ncbi:MAG: isochorismatase family protein, partial [Deltaproteobacteria bacterium]|nr:isochorismatase family protein [Deltaproteobacteria bacterium]
MMGRTAILVIDMLNDFVDKDGALYVQGAEKLIPNIQKLIKHFDNVIFVCDEHDQDDIEFKTWPVHAVFGTNGAKLIR